MKEREALQKISRMTLPISKVEVMLQNKLIKTLATEALKEPTERCYSNEVGSIDWLIRRLSEQGWHGFSTNEIHAICTKAIESRFTQSLPQKKGKEEVKPSGIDLEKLQNKVDKMFEKETFESFNEWLKQEQSKREIEAFAIHNFNKINNLK